MIRRLFSGLLLLGGVILLGVAAWEYRVFSDGPGVTIEDPNREVRVDAGQPTLVAFHVHNPTRHRVRIVGLAVC